MYTVCPGCTRQFQIYAEHLSAAAGQVRCGFCHEQFNATERLYDKPLSNEEALDKQPVVESVEEEEPQFDIPEKIKPSLDVPEEKESVVVTSNESGNVLENAQETVQENTEEKVQGLETAINEIGIDSSVEETKNTSKQEPQEAQESIQQSNIDASEEITVRKKVEIQDEVKQESSQPVDEAEDKAVSEEQFNFAEVEESLLLDESPKVKSRWSWLVSFFWTVATLAALIIIVAQLAWFNRDRLLLEYPELLPYAKQVCAELDCQLIREKDVSKIKLVNRDVRLHPTYQDTLLVNAAMKNELSIRQPYPKVQLTLFDTSGSLLGYREFVPEDYLDNSIEIDKGMPTDSPVYFVLEVSGPTAGAVSFEFRFL
ncbi:MAG: DUF3426 domain-containing protein [Gammaproteobacteria bacterium]|jgi:predicted Zn finger-like uncharacterized protein